MRALYDVWQQTWLLPTGRQWPLQVVTTRKVSRPLPGVPSRAETTASFGALFPPRSVRLHAGRSLRPALTSVPTHPLLLTF